MGFGSFSLVISVGSHSDKMVGKSRSADNNRGRVFLAAARNSESRAVGASPFASICGRLRLPRSLGLGFADDDGALAAMASRMNSRDVGSKAGGSRGDGNERILGRFVVKDGAFADRALRMLGRGGGVRLAGRQSERHIRWLRFSRCEELLRSAGIGASAEGEVGCNKDFDSNDVVFVGPHGSRKERSQDGRLGRPGQDTVCATAGHLEDQSRGNDG